MYIMIADERFEWNHTASALQVHCKCIVEEERMIAGVRKREVCQ